jgi:transposase
MARPQIEINKEHFENLCNMQCTLEEIAGFFKCSKDTIERWCERTYEEGFADTYKKYSQNGKISLRRYQFKLAEKNASMAIWLGKQYLGQTDVITAQTTEDFVRNLDSIYDKLKNPAKNRTIEEMED